MTGPVKRIWLLLSVSCLILVFGRADAQQAPQAPPQNPYLMGTEGYDKGPRGLTSYQPIAIDQPFADQDGSGRGGKAGHRTRTPGAAR